jgi:hypothetical protein
MPSQTQQTIEKQPRDGLHANQVLEKRQLSEWRRCTPCLQRLMYRNNRTKSRKRRRRKAAKPTQPKARETKQQPAVNPASNPASSNLLAAPGVHINLEIHISADATADQIDLIFAAMAKHIYKRV